VTVDTRTEKVPIRAPFWSRYFRWAVVFQIGWAFFLGFGLLLRGVGGDWQLREELVYAWAIVSGVLAVLALFIAFRRRHLGCAEITPAGIRPYTIRHGWDIRYRWAEMETVRVKAGPFGNRWLEVVPKDAPPFKLTARPTDPLGVLDALERFAGPDHPLTQAYATLLSDP